MFDQPAAGAVEYRDVPGFPGYRVGDDGSVWSCLLRGIQTGARGTWKQLRPERGRQGYLRVVLQRSGRRRRVSVHRLVLEAFVGPCPAGLEGLHKNDIKDDCRLANLYWGTKRQNWADRKVNGSLEKCAYGERHRGAKLTEDRAKEVLRRGLAGESIDSLAGEFGISRSQVWNIIVGRAWRHLEGRPSEVLRRPRSESAAHLATKGKAKAGV